MAMLNNQRVYIYYIFSKSSKNWPPYHSCITKFQRASWEPDRLELHLDPKDSSKIGGWSKVSPWVFDDDEVLYF